MNCEQYLLVFLDLVAAYKSQLRENETLQATIKSLQTAAASKKKDESGTEEQVTITGLG